MANRILVPLDGSALAERALPCAITLARGLPAELVLFRAISLPSDIKEILNDADLEAGAPLEQLEAEADDYLRKVAGQLEGNGLRVHQVVRQGPAAEAIVDYAGQMDIQQIVMATHGYSGISRWRHGSVAERVLQSASEPVLMICAQRAKGNASHEPMACRRILVPLDGSSLAEQVLPPATTVVQALDAEIILFRVPIVSTSGSLMGEWCMPLGGVFETAGQDAQAYLNHMADGLKERGLKVTTAMRTGGVADAIIEYAEANRIDLIAMCTHGRTGPARWTLGSVADRVLRARCTPLLLVRARRSPVSDTLT
jgi:nucleotide-binding universal stress UspA family protein